MWRSPKCHNGQSAYGCYCLFFSFFFFLETRASIERKKRLAQIHHHHQQASHVNKPTTYSTNPSPSSSYTINTPAPCSSSAHSPINLKFNSGVNQTKPFGQGVGTANKTVGGGVHANNSNNQAGGSGKTMNSKLQPASHR